MAVIAMGFPLFRTPRRFLALYWPILLLTTHWPKYFHGTDPGLQLDKIAHFFAYGLLAALLALSMNGAAWSLDEARRRSGRRIFMVLLIVAMSAILDEITQPWTGREADKLDWMADMMGACCGLWVATRFARLDASPLAKGGLRGVSVPPSSALRPPPFRNRPPPTPPLQGGEEDFQRGD